MSAIPRIRGRVGTAEDGEHKGKWFYEISIWDLGGEHQAGPPFQFGPFESETIACEFGRNKTKEISEQIETFVTGKISGRYLDFKNGGIMRPWDEQ